MELSEIKKNYVFTTRVEIDEENFVELREPTQSELAVIAKDKNNADLDTMASLFPKCVVDSSFTKNGEKVSGPELYNELKNSGSIFTEILSTWLESIPFQRRLLKKEK